MLIKMIRRVVLPLLLLHAGSAYALIDAEVLAGKRWYELGMDPKQHVSSQEIAVAAHIDPIPLVPVSFGLKAASGTLNTNDLKSYYGADNISAGSMMELGLDFKAWIPLVPIFTPYVRLTVPFAGMWKEGGSTVSATNGTQTFTHNAHIYGAQLSIGAKYELLPLISLELELNRSAETWREIDDKDKGIPMPADSKARVLNSNGVFLGLEVGF